MNRYRVIFKSIDNVKDVNPLTKQVTTLPYKEVKQDIVEAEDALDAQEKISEKWSRGIKVKEVWSQEETENNGIREVRVYKG